jgi:hypothetical protein
MDAVTVDLGYVTNAGFTLLQGNYVPEDDLFAIAVQLQMLDNGLEVNNAVFNVTLALKLEDKVIVGTPKPHLRL